MKLLQHSLNRCHHKRDQFLQLLTHTVSYALAVEEIGRACGGTGLSYAATISLGASPIYYFGTEEQKQKYLVPMASGKTLGAFGLTEPNAGSDAGGTQTKAVLDGDE
ncbi:acyl-CoA dehydrogenase family protein, partial [Bacillus cereus]|uniref:acyl-CoA dehydrogenase family protein n=1 Tax=Bacillus cereus TaxID=1396 RepID=UPI00396D405B